MLGDVEGELLHLRQVVPNVLVLVGALVFVVVVVVVMVVVVIIMTQIIISHLVYGFILVR